MQLVEFVALSKRNKGCLNSFIAIRSNAKPNTRSYYFLKNQRLNYLFKHLWQFSQMPMATYESLFLQHLPKCQLKITIHPKTSDSEVAQQIQDYYLFLKLIITILKFNWLLSLLFRESNQIHSHQTFFKNY
jgi:hypothetical protein